MCAWERKVGMKEVQEALQDHGRSSGCRMCMGAEGGDEGGARDTAGPRPRLRPQFRRQAQASTLQLSGKACASITQNLHCKEPIPKIRNKYPRKGIARPQSQFPDSCVRERFIYSHDRSAYSALGNMWIVDRSWEYINRPQTHECGNWDEGRAIPRKGIHKWDFRCSVYRDWRRMNLLCECNGMNVCTGKYQNKQKRWHHATKPLYKMIVDRIVSSIYLAEEK